MLISCGITNFCQLLRQLSQLVGVGGVVTHHVLHQGSQLLHGAVVVAMALVVMSVFMAMTAALVVVVMVVAVTAATVAVIVCMALTVEVIVGMGMLVIMAVLMGMLMGVGDAIVGMLVGMRMLVVVVVRTANVVVMNMHSFCSFTFFLYYTICKE